MNHIELYCKNVITPIEEQVKDLRRKVYSKNIFDFLMRSTYKEYLDKTEELLFSCYQKLGEYINDEISFQKELKEKFPDAFKDTKKQSLY